MRTLLRLLPAALATLLLGAHFLRLGLLLPFLLCWILPFLLFWRRPFVRWIFMILLLFGAGAWILTTLQLVMARQLAGAPYLRLSLILGGVTLFDLLAAGLLLGRRMDAYFRPTAALPGPPG